MWFLYIIWLYNEKKKDKATHNMPDIVQDTNEDGLSCQ